MFFRKVTSLTQITFAIWSYLMRKFCIFEVYSLQNLSCGFILNSSPSGESVPQQSKHHILIFFNHKTQEMQAENRKKLYKYEEAESNLGCTSPSKSTWFKDAPLSKLLIFSLNQTALETGRTFGTVFSDLNLRHNLLTATNVTEFKAHILVTSNEFASHSFRPGNN